MEARRESPARQLRHGLNEVPDETLKHLYLLWYNYYQRIEMVKRKGRPKVPATRKRTEILRFFVTKSEDLKIREAANLRRLTLSEFLRSAARSSTERREANDANKK